MKNIKSFEDYNKLEEGWKTNVTAGLIGASSLLGGNVSAKGDKEQSRRNIELHNQDSVKQYQKWGWTLDSTSFEKVLDEQPTIEAVKLTLDIGQNFASGKYNLDNKGIQKIDSLFKYIEENNLVIDSIEIESSTDKTPISNRMAVQTGINNNLKLSKNRCNSIIDYLDSNGYVSKENLDYLKTDIKTEQGGINDPSARYVKVVVYTIKDYKHYTFKDKTTYHLSRETNKGQGKDFSILTSHPKNKNSYRLGHNRPVKCARP